MTQLSTGWLGAWALIGLFVLVTLLMTNDSAARGRGRGGAVDLTGTTELEAQFFTDLRDGRGGRWSLADAFFIASGIRKELDLKRARAWIDDATMRAREVVRAQKGTEARADHLLRWIHEQLFSTYRASATDAVSLIRYGQYNCLSSCLIYGIIAERLGFKVTGVAVDRHAFCRVYAGEQAHGRGWDVETTTPLGFNPGRDIKISNAVVSVPRSRYRNRREMSLFELMGLLYTNHMGLNGAYPSVQDRLLAYQKAALFHPTEPTIQHNIIASYTQLVSQLIDQRSWDQAWLYLEQLRGLGLKRSKGSAERERLRREHTETLMIELTKRHVEQVWSQGQDRYASEVLSGYQRARSELREPLYLIEARLELQRARASFAQARAPSSDQSGLERYAQALKLGKRATRSTSGFERQTRRLIQVMKTNHLAMAKNLIIDALNAGQTELASRLCAVALSHHPRDLDFKQYQRASAGR